MRSQTPSSSPHWVPLRSSVDESLTPSVAGAFGLNDALRWSMRLSTAIDMSLTAFFSCFPPLHFFMHHFALPCVFFGLSIALSFFFNVYQLIQCACAEHMTLGLCLTTLVMLLETALFSLAVVAGVLLMHVLPAVAWFKRISALMPYFFLVSNAIDVLYHLVAAWLDWKHLRWGKRYQETTLDYRISMVNHLLSALKSLCFLGLILVNLLNPSLALLTICLAAVSILSLIWKRGYSERYMEEGFPCVKHFLSACFPLFPEPKVKAWAWLSNQGPFKPDDWGLANPHAFFEKPLFACSPRWSLKMSKCLDAIDRAENEMKKTGYRLLQGALEESIVRTRHRFFVSRYQVNVLKDILKMMQKETMNPVSWPTALQKWRVDPEFEKKMKKNIWSQDRGGEAWELLQSAELYYTAFQSEHTVHVQNDDLNTHSLWHEGSQATDKPGIHRWKSETVAAPDLA